MSAIRIGFFMASNDMDIKSPKPLSFGYLKAYLESQAPGDFEMEYFDGPFDARSLDILALSTTTQAYPIAVEAARSAKEANSGIITIIGGHHVTYLPEMMADCFDIGIIGEGEHTFADLVTKAVDNRLSLDHDVLAGIQGIVFRHEGSSVVTDPRPLIEPLDSLPHPFRFREKAQYIFSSRGCPYKCVFCSSSAFWKKTRMFSAGYVVEEIEQILHNIPETERIPFQDDLFVLNRKRLLEFAALMEEKKLARRVPYVFSVRANLVDQELCDILKRFNLGYVAFGAESASDRMLDLLGKGTTREMNQNAINLLTKNGINTVCSFIVGIPGETEEEVNSTYNFAYGNMAAGRVSINSIVNILMPMPGTRLWQTAIDRGIIKLDGFDWKKLSVFASYRASSLPLDFDEWLAIREESGAVYLNEAEVPFSRMAQLMRKHEARISRLERMLRIRVALYAFKFVNYVRRLFL
ncbi:MAG TPA: radical SAM protein [bacterium]|nr:radical SAM protein [bacterium]